MVILPSGEILDSLHSGSETPSKHPQQGKGVARAQAIALSSEVLQPGQSNQSLHSASPDPGPPALRFPPEDSGRSLAEMAQRDLDAALQLLSDRAQYITGATGAAIALRRDGKKDMLCRASSGPTAPELGALLSTEHGLSGESVRTRQLLRCDDAERDGRVNREVCRLLGIASVVVMPVVHDDEVLGVFELFSGKTNAFSDRDLSAVQRLTQMVETAVRLAQVTTSFPEQLKQDSTTVGASADPKPVKDEGEEILDAEIFQPRPADAVKAEAAVVTVSRENEPEEPSVTPAPLVEAAGPEAAVACPVSAVTAPSIAAVELATVASSTVGGFGMATSFDIAGNVTASGSTAPKKPLFWSAALNTAEEQKSESEENNIPPVLRGLRKCEVCGFPITAGRTLCVECEEKKWRGQLKRTQPMPTGSLQSTAAKPEGKALAAAAQAMTPIPAAPAEQKRVAKESGASGVAAQPASVGSQCVPQTQTAGVAHPKEDRTAASVEAAENPALTSEPAETPELVLSAGLEPHQSWFAAHKFKIVMMVIAVAAIVVFLLSR